MPEVKGKIVILVDDGIATGSTVVLAVSGTANRSGGFLWRQRVWFRSSAAWRMKSSVLPCRNYSLPLADGIGTSCR
jgi:hypothetical protein